MLREFEDQENILSEMDEQVGAYRDRGQQEAACRLEDQLLLIHERFQELLMKFELFQQQSAVDFEPRLDRVHRQLRDIRQKIYLTDLASADSEGEYSVQSAAENLTPSLFSKTLSWQHTVLRCITVAYTG